MQIKNSYRRTADDIIKMIDVDRNKANEIIRDLVNEYNSMPCGLVWKVADEVKEKVFIDYKDYDASKKDNNTVVRNMDDCFAYLKYNENLSMVSATEQPPNSFIIGDNYHVLQIMQDKFRGQFSFIYCDVPYNTGAKDFKYNDNYVDSSDPWKDAKWLSFINKRFKLIRDLLQPSGVLAVSIDDYEMAQLVLLLDEIFRRQNRLAICPIEVNPSGKNRKGIAIQHEYLLLYTVNYEQCRDRLHSPLVKGFAKTNTNESTLKFIANEKGKVFSTMDALAEVMKCTGKYNSEKERDSAVKVKCEKKYPSAYDMAKKAKYFDDKGPFKKRGIIKTGSDSNAADRLTMTYNIYYDSCNMGKEVEDVDFEPIFYLKDDLENLSEDIRSKLICIEPIDNNGVRKRWSWKDTNVVNTAKQGGNLYVIKDTTSRGSRKGEIQYFISYREYVKYTEDVEPVDITPKSVTDFRVEVSYSSRLFGTFISDTRYQTTQGTNQLKKLIGKDYSFDYPKPVDLIKDIIKVFTKPNDIIGDFFVGSGTTMEAVLSVNKESDRNLRFITCTNNEGNIAHDVTLKRIQALKKEGYDINLNVFEVDYEVTGDGGYDDVGNNKDVIDKMCEHVEDYYKLVYNVTREYPLGNNGLKCLINDYDGIVLLIKKMPTDCLSMVDFTTQTKRANLLIDRITRGLPDDIHTIYVEETDIKESFDNGISPDEMYPINLIEKIVYAFDDTKDKSGIIIGDAPDEASIEEERKLLHDLCVDDTVDEDDSDMYDLDFEGDEEEDY